MTIARIPPYFSASSISTLAETLRGDEKVYLGVRPFGFHAGNKLALVAYPILLCSAMEKRGITPNFRFYLFLNDYEQFEITGPNPKVYRFNICPKDTTIQFARPNGLNMTAADYWSPIIIGAVSDITRTYKDTELIPVRNSDMKELPVFREVLTKTLRSPELVANAIRKATGKSVLPNAEYALPLYPDTHNAAHEYVIHDDDSITIYRDGKDIGTYAYESLDYWFHHKPLALPRIVQYGIELCITGNDHHSEGDFKIRHQLLDDFGLLDRTPDFSTLYTQKVLAADGQKMSKSRRNGVDYPLSELVALALAAGDVRELALPTLSRSMTDVSLALDLQQ